MLFLNKCDLLRSECNLLRLGSLAHLYRLAKLAAGAKFSHSVVSYGDRPNDYESITTCACLYAVLCGAVSLQIHLLNFLDLRKKFGE